MKSIVTVSRKDPKVIFERLQAFACAEERPFAFFRLPRDDRFHFFSGKSGGLEKVAPAFTDLKRGFVIAPFQTNEEVHYFPNDFEVEFEQGNVRYSGITEDELFSRNLSCEKKYYSSEGKTDFEKTDYKAIVAKAVEAIKNNQALKIVLSRFEEKTLPTDFSLYEAFLKLCTTYPHAFVCCFSAPETGTWLCATPELLVSHDADHIFRTVALAGTQPHTGQSLKEYAWRDKEIEEQALVGRYIINCFKKIRLREYEEIGPRTVSAGNLVHLCSTFAVDTKKACFPDLVSVMCRLLHPTSAVCGMPKKESEDFILQHEGYPREFYSGFLGPVFGDNCLSLFVHLRCLQLYETHARLYAGAGITADSDPEKEYNETAHKFQTVGKILDR